MAPTVDPTPDTAPKKERGRKSVIVPVVPLVSKPPMSRKERRKSKQIVIGTHDTETETSEDAGKVEGSQDVSVEGGSSSRRLSKDDGSNEKVKPEISASPVSKTPVSEAETTNQRQEPIATIPEPTEPVPQAAPAPQTPAPDVPPSDSALTSAPQPPTETHPDDTQNQPHITFGGPADSSVTSPSVPPPALPTIPLQPTPAQYSASYTDPANRALFVHPIPPPIIPLEYGYQNHISQPRGTVYPAAPVPPPVFYGYNPKVPSFFPTENHSPYSPTETSSGIRSGPWSVPNHSATSNSSVEAEVKIDVKPAVADDVTVTIEDDQRGEQNEIMGVVTTAEVIPTPDAVLIPQSDDEQDGLSVLPEYLLSLFHTGAYTDWTLQVASPHSLFEPTPILVHALLAARSPFLQSQMKAHYENPVGITVLVFSSTHCFLRPQSFRVALRRLYGDSLLQKEVLAQLTAVYSAEGTTSSPSKAQMEFALGYSVAGNLLQLPGVERRGLQLAAGCLDWGTLETALNFELTGDVKSWVKTNDEAQRNSTPKSGASQRSNSMSDTTPSNSYHQAQDGRRVLEIASGSLAEPPFANEVSKAAFKFLVSNFPVDFQLDTSVMAQDMPDRLPYVKVSRPVKTRLSSLRFGNLPSEDETRFSNESRTVSRILLTVPFDMLEALFGGLKGKISKSTATLVIDERERRRLAVLNSKPGSDDQLAKDSDWYAVGWEESIKDKDVDDFELVRTPKGLQESSEKQAS